MQCGQMRNGAFSLITDTPILNDHIKLTSKLKYTYHLLTMHATTPISQKSITPSGTIHNPQCPYKRPTNKI